MVVGLVLIGVVLIGVVWMLLIVSCLLWLFYEVGVWLVTGWYGYVYMRDRLMGLKRVPSVGCTVRKLLSLHHLRS